MEKRIRKTLVLIAITAFLHGCATFQPNPISPDQTAKAFEARTLNSAGLKTQFWGRVSAMK